MTSSTFLFVSVSKDNASDILAQLLEDNFAVKLAYYAACEINPDELNDVIESITSESIDKDRSVFQHYAELIPAITEQFKAYTSWVSDCLDGKESC